MRGGDKRTGELFSYVDLEKRVRSGHPLRAIRGLVNEALVALEHEFHRIPTDRQVGSLDMAEQRVERRLAAVLAADVAGYSRLMGADEEGTLARLNAHRREFLEP